MSEESLFRNNYTAYIEQKNKEIQSKDQQIKDLEELLVLADNVLMYSKDRPPLASNHYYDKKQSYQQKYPKP